ncbi:MAG: site-specific integrase [Ignavibacteriae bacterium]|nr:MAG: site-specific integrase [Ignavibacteriota bacterium]
MFISKGYKGVYDLYITNLITGKRTKISTGTKKRNDAYKFLRDYELSNSLAANKPISQHYTLNNLRDDVLSYVKINFEFKTMKVYTTTLNNFINFLGNIQVKQLTVLGMEKYKSYRSNLVSKTTINIEIRTLIAAFNIAVKLNLIIQNPIKGIKQFTIPQKDKLSFSSEEINLILLKIHNENFRNLIKFALLTGCRLNEILNIQLKDIDFIKLVLTIRNKPDFKIKTGKIRYIPISDHLLEVIQSILSHSGNVIELSEPEKYLFTNNMGRKLFGNHVSKLFKKYLRTVSLPEKFHFHCLRHTFITNLIKNGVNINFTKQLAGHSDIKTTMGYIHIETEDLRDAVNMIKIA